MSLRFPGLERISQLAFILMCATVTAVGVQRLMANDAPAAPRKAPPPVEAGTKLELHDDLRAGSSRASLILGLSTACQFCTESMGFYRTLADLDVVRDGRLRLGVVSLQTPDAMRLYMSEHRLPIDPVVQFRESGVPIASTPAVFLVKGDGVVERSWVGQLAKEDERLLIKTAREAVMR